MINRELSRRTLGQNPYNSPRKEPDNAEILSGVFEGRTTGAPISILIPNKDADPSKYEPIKDLLRPVHANYTYLEKYGTYKPTSSIMKPQETLTLGEKAAFQLPECLRHEQCAALVTADALLLNRSAKN